jgi:hypothetical protein
MNTFSVRPNISVTRFNLGHLVPNGSSECKWLVGRDRGVG